MRVADGLGWPRMASDGLGWPLMNSLIMQVGISLVLLGEADLGSDAAMHAWLSRSLPLDGSWTLQAYVKH